MTSNFAPPNVSRAIPIVAPTSEHSGGRQTPSSPIKKNEGRTLCKNVIIYGSCRNEGKGCMFFHPAREDPAPRPTTPTPIYDDATLPAVLASPPLVNINAPVFVPRSVPTSLLSENVTTPAPPPETDLPVPPYDEQTPSHPQEYGDSVSLNDAQDYSEYSTSTPYLPGGPLLLGSDPYYATPYPLQPLNYHLYAQMPLNISEENRLFISDTLRQDLQQHSDSIHANPSPPAGLPEEVHTYHSLAPLDAPVTEKRKFWAGWPSSVYKAFNRKDGRCYALRRIEGFRLLHEAAFGAVEKWSHITHPNVVQIKEAFTSRHFGDHSLVFAYDFFPNAQTLFHVHFGQPSSTATYAPLQTARQAKDGRNNPSPSGTGTTTYPGTIPEQTLWSYIIQIASAIKAVHEAGLAVRLLDLSKIILVGKNRLRLNCCGVFDVVAYNPVVGVEIMQQEDLFAFGRLIYLLGAANVNALNDPQKAMQTLIRTYGPDLNQLAYYLISPPKSGQRKSIDDIFANMGSRLLQEMNASQSYADDLENELMGELENARLVRLLSKFGFINERPDFGHESRWSETGDRYIVKLFRDYVFHQVDETGRPVVNMSHVLTCLNKLDAGADERIMLISRDEQSCLVVSYREVKGCVEQAFSELTRGSK